MGAVAIRSDRRWFFQYVVMLGLSVLIAVMGLSLDSAAIVIGAMLLAPLMNPVLGLSAAISLALPRHLARSTVLVMASTGSAIVLAYLVAKVLPDGTLTSETLSRTSPDLRDLIVALAAGAAGAYATVRQDVSSSLPGVAVAVALVPPLAAVGLTLQAGRGDLAEGAAMLFAANLCAIVLVGVFVFVVTGLVPSRRLQQKRTHVAASAVLVAAITVVIAIPLTVASINAAASGRERESIQAAVDRWLGGTANELDEVRIDADIAHIRITGPTAPPDTAELDRAIQAILGPGGSTQIRWTQSRDPDKGGDKPSVSEPAAESEAAVRAIVKSWLETAAPARFDITRLVLTDAQISVDLTSASPPPAVDNLTNHLADALGLTIPVVVNWTERTTLRPGAQSNETVRGELERQADAWARSSGQGLSVAAVHYDGERATIDIQGPTQVDVTALHSRLQDVVGTDIGIDIWFTQRTRLEPTTTTS